MTKLYINPLPVRLWHWANAVLVIILVVTKAVTGLRASDIDIDDGLDVTHHGERAYTP